MISIVVYGRNDNHGYNLHKRAAISLNCLAAILRAPDDELIFVDYNSADDLPTFPEAIADTLTPQARERLRILRVRPTVHSRYAARTNLAAIEAVARNVGVRRSNPANRWVLSTNTDIILLLRQAHDLSAVASELPAGFYHTARFEIPESLWESFDRRDPSHIMDEVRLLGRTARLNELVYGSETILFDGPGDFQLIQRADLFAIDGFDEAMLRSWHVDSNIAKRLSLYRGPVRPLIDQVLCYHCDHTRQITTAHKRGSPGNDAAHFVDAVIRPELPEQRDTWGCAGDDIEEIRLTADTAYRRTLGNVVTPLDRDFTKVYYTASTFDSYEYDPQHVVPFFADLLSCLPRQVNLAWCGVRPDMFGLATRLWREMGFLGDIVVHPAALRYLVPDGNGGTGRDDWLAADLFVFEFALPQDGSSAPEALAGVESGLLAAVAAEHARIAGDPVALRRRFIGINCIHNRAEQFFGEHIGAALTPFSSRLRHGFVIEPTPDSQSDQDRAARLLIGHALGRAGPVDAYEMAFATQVFGPLVGGGSILPADVLRAASHASLGQAYVTALGDKRGGRHGSETIQRAIDTLEQLRPSTRLAAELDVPIVEPAEPIQAMARPLSRFAAFEDWDDPDWLRFTRHLGTAPDEASAHRRSSARWEQVHLLYGLDRTGCGGAHGRVLVVARMPDAVIAALSRIYGTVDLFGVCAAAPSPASERARAFWCAGGPYDPKSLRVLGAGTRIEALEPCAYDAVVFPHGAMFAEGLIAALNWLRRAEPLLRPEGVVAFKAEIAAGAKPHAYLDTRAVTGSGLAGELAKATRFRVEDGFDPALSRTTVDKVCPPEGGQPGEGYFLTRDDGRVLIPSYWFLRLRQEEGGASWDRLRSWVEDRWCGEQLPWLQVGNAGRRVENAINSIPGAQGHVFFGPYAAIASGTYRATLSFRKNRRKFIRATFEASLGSDTVSERLFNKQIWRAESVTLEFSVPAAPAGEAPRLLELRLYSPGGLDITITGLAVERQTAAEAGAWPDLPAIPGGTSQPGIASGVAAAPELRPLEPVRASASETVLRNSGHPAPTRLASLSDWENPAWRAFLDSDARNSGEWERTHLLWALDRLGKLRFDQRVLVAAVMRDAAIARLTEHVRHVEVFDLTGEAKESGAAARLYWTDGSLYARDRLSVYADGAALEQDGFGAVVFPHGALLHGGVAGMARLLAAADTRLATDGLIGFKVDILSGTEPHPDFPDQALLGPGGLAAKIESETGFRLEGDHAALSADDFDTNLRHNDFRVEQGERSAIPSWWFFRKRQPTPAGGWDRIERWLLDRILGEQVHRLALGAAGRRDMSGGIIAAEGGRGRIFFGPYLGLPHGSYEAVIGIKAAGTGAAKIMVDVTSAGRELQKKMVRIPPGSQTTLRLPFVVPAEGLGHHRVEIRAWREAGRPAFDTCRVIELNA